MELRTQRLILREFRESDFEAFYDYESNPQTHHYEREVPAKESIRETLLTIERWAQEEPRTHYYFAVNIYPNQQAVGQISLNSLNRSIREWEIGWTIHYAHWGKGYATEAAQAVLHFAFTELHVHRVTAFCHVLNAPSIRVMEKLGMQREGHLRHVRWWNAGWSDEYVFAILDCDWQGSRKTE